MCTNFIQTAEKESFFVELNPASTRSTKLYRSTNYLVAKKSWKLKLMPNLK